MSYVNVGLIPISGSVPIIRLSVESNSNGPDVAIHLSPDEARAIGLQLKVMADQIDKIAAKQPKAAT